MILHRFVVSILFLSLCTCFVSSQSVYRDTHISLLTAASGDELYSTFGHTGIRVLSPNQGIDEVYNYGIYDFRTPNFYPKFLRGRLPYHIAKQPYRNFMYAYAVEKRSVWEQRLHLSDQQKETLLVFLENNMKPENSQYKYDFLLDNCTTRAHGAITEVGNIHLATDTLKTYRKYLKDHLAGMPWTEFGIDLILAAPTDRIPQGKNRHFLPVMLMEAYEHVQNGSSTLSDTASLVLDYQAEGRRRATRGFNYPLWVFIAFLAWELILLIKAPKGSWLRIYDKLINIVLAIVSLIMMVMWFGTDHKATKYNWNLLWASPAFIVLFFLKKERRRLTYILLAVCLIVSAINAGVQFLPQYFHIAILPLSLALLVNVCRQMRDDGATHLA